MLLGTGRPRTEDGSTAYCSNVSPDERAVVYCLSRPGAPGADGLWVTELASGRSELLSAVGIYPKWSPDQRQIAYMKKSPDSAVTAVAVQPLGGAERLITPWRAGQWKTPSGWSADGQAVLVTNGAIEVWPVMEASTRPSRIALAMPNANLWEATFSPNSRWLTFSMTTSGSGSEVGISSADGSPNRSWTRVAADHTWVDKPRWSPDGKRLYFLASEGSFLNIWATNVDPDQGATIGEPFAVSHFNSPGLKVSPEVSMIELDVSRHYAFLTMQATAGNIWMLDNVDR